MSQLPVIEIESWVGRILELEPNLSKICVIYPRMAFSLKRGLIEGLGIRASELIKVRVANVKSSDDLNRQESPLSPIEISAKVRFLHLSNFIDASKPATLFPLESLAGDEDEAKGYVFIHCWFNTAPEDNADGTIRLLYKDAIALAPRKDDVLTISISPK